MISLQVGLINPFFYKEYEKYENNYFCFKMVIKDNLII